MRRNALAIEVALRPEAEQGDVLLDAVHHGVAVEVLRRDPGPRRVLVVQHHLATPPALLEEVDLVLAPVVGVADGAEVARQFDPVIGPDLLAHFACCRRRGRLARFDLARGQSPQPGAEVCAVDALEQQQARGVVEQQVQREARGGGEFVFMARLEFEVSGMVARPANHRFRAGRMSPGYAACGASRGRGDACRVTLAWATRPGGHAEETSMGIPTTGASVARSR